MSKANKQPRPDASPETQTPPPAAVAEPESVEVGTEELVAEALRRVTAQQAAQGSACLEYSRALGHLSFALHWLQQREKRLTGPKPAGPLWG